MRARTPPPPWFVALVAAALALAFRKIYGVTSFDVIEHPPGTSPGLAFLGFLIPIVSAIWTGVQVAAKVTLTALAWSVKALWVFALKVWDGALGLGKLLGKGFREAWHFMRATYTHVLKPAWTKFWRFVEASKKWLDKYVGPVLRFLQKVRKYLLELYDKWIRPILDVIGVARRVLQLLASLGVDWARALDRKLAELEERIDGTFRRALGYLNEVINLVNRVVTADGLFQRLAYIRTLQRDVQLVMNVWWNAAHRGVTDDERRAATDEPETKPLAVHVAEVRAVTRAHGGPLQSRVSEEVIDVKLLIRRARTGSAGIV